MNKHPGVAFNLNTSMHYHVKSRTLTHYPSDTKEAETYSKDIEYRFNDNGFRCDYNMNNGLKSMNVNMFLGCSNTLGIGVNLEETWCYHINASFTGTRTMLNMGQGGGSAETCYRLAREWIPIIKPKDVFMLSPPETRREFWKEEHTPVIVGPKSTLPKTMVSEREIQLNRYRVKDAIENICRQHNIPFTYMYMHGLFEKTFNGEFNDFGRDGQHPGPESHKVIAKHFK